MDAFPASTRIKILRWEQCPKCNEVSHPRQDVEIRGGKWREKDGAKEKRKTEREKEKETEIHAPQKEV